MADFCKQCAEELFEKNCPSDFEGLTTVEDSVKGVYAEVLCEGCGNITVDHTGECIDSECPRHGNPSKLLKTAF